MRDHGTGSFRQRADGRWEARLSLNGRQLSFYGSTRREAQLRLVEGRRRQEQGLNPGSETVRQFLLRWLEEVARPSVRSSSYERYAEVVKHQLLPSLGAIKLSQLGVEPIQAMLNRLAREGRSPEKVRAVLRNALGVAVKWRLLSWNPAALADLPSWTPRPAQWLELPQALCLVREAKGTWLEPIVTLALSAALREGEILGLRWQDVDLKARTLSIRGQLQPVRGPEGRRRLTIVPVKSRASAATVPLPEIAYRALLEQRSRHRVRSLHGLVFTTRKGTPISPRNLLRSYKRLLERAELPPSVRFHDLRHSTASLLVANGVDPVTAQAILRHANVRTTLGIYSHAMPENVREASRTLGVLLTQDLP